MAMKNNSEIKLEVRSRLTGKWTRPVLVSGICLSAEMIRAVILMPFASSGGTLPLVLGTAVNFILALLTYLLTAGEAYFHLAFLRGEEPALVDMFSVFRMQPDRFLILGFVWFIPELLPDLISLLPIEALRHPLAVILLYAAALVLLAVLRTTLALAIYLLADNPALGVLEAMRMSAGFMRGRKLRLLGLVLSFIGYFLLGLLSIGIGLVFVYPYFHLTLASFYLETLTHLTERYQKSSY